MKVLLIGKFPPCQGGIAAKSYWLFRVLSERDVEFDVVTVAPDFFTASSPDTYQNQYGYIRQNSRRRLGLYPAVTCGSSN